MALRQIVLALLPSNTITSNTKNNNSMHIRLILPPDSPPLMASYVPAENSPLQALTRTLCPPPAA